MEQHSLPGQATLTRTQREPLCADCVSLFCGLRATWCLHQAGRHETAGCDEWPSRRRRKGRVRGWHTGVRLPLFAISPPGHPALGPHVQIQSRPPRSVTVACPPGLPELDP